MIETETHAAQVLDSAEGAAADAIGGLELALIAFVALLLSPPLLILLVIVVVPAVAIGLVASVLVLPVMVGRRLHRHRLERRG